MKAHTVVWEGSNRIVELTDEELDQVSGGNPIVVAAVVVGVRWAVRRVAKAAVGGFVGGAVGGYLRKRYGN